MSTAPTSKAGRAHSGLIPQQSRTLLSVEATAEWVKSSKGEEMENTALHPVSAVSNTSFQRTERSQELPLHFQHILQKNTHPKQLN